MQNEILKAARSDSWKGGSSFTLRNRLYRFAWMLTWKLLAGWTPPQMHAWRRFLLRSYGAKIAPTARVYPSASIWSPANLEMSDFACVGPHVNVYCMANIKFGPYALASQGAHLCAGTHDIEDVAFQLEARPIVIDARAWVAADAFVGPGVRIGEGAVLGARGVAFRDLEPWTVYLGNPAAAIKHRRVRFPQAGGT